MQKIERLSQNFESLYENEVLLVSQKLVNHSGFEQLDAETMKELNDVLVGANEIPKAPWEDGVCKVCGIDRDDDSVLLCDKCDSEYHKYCLNPPLARIPEGNWYCPSCVMRQRKQHTSQHTQDIRRHPRRRTGDGNYSTQEELYQLAKAMEEREYWEFSTEERILLLKFLCDEVLNSAIIREHLEQCVDKSNDLQQKLRALTLDWRNLKFKEELLAMSVNEYTSRSCGTGDVLREGGGTVIYADRGNLTEQQYSSNGLVYATNISVSPLKEAIPVEGCVEDNGRADASKDLGHLLNSVIENHANSNMPCAQFSRPDFVVDEDGVHNNDILSKITIHGNPSQQLNGGGEMVLDIDHRDVQRRLLGDSKSTNGCLGVGKVLCVETNGTMQSKPDKFHGSDLPSDNERTHLGESTVTMVSGAGMLAEESPSAHQSKVLEGSQFTVNAGVGESEASNLEHNSLKNEILQLQDSFASLESQLMMTSLRRDFIGRDSVGRSYWVIGKPGKRPWLAVAGSVPMKRRKVTKMRDSKYPRTSCSFSQADDVRQADGDSSVGTCHSSPLFIYESDFEIQLLLCWLRDSDSRERELKESILQRKRLLFHQGNITVSNDPNQELYPSTEKITVPRCSTIKATIILEKKYGPCSDLESENPKKRGRKPKVSNEDRMYRCECLEPVWPSRHHCLSCHQTYCTVKELEEHNDGRCTSLNPSSDEVKDGDDSIRGKGVRSESTREKYHADAVDTTETLRKGKFDSASKFVKFQRKTCPFDFDEICKKFVIDNSPKESVKEIGLIGSHGVASLISSPPMFFDPPLLLNQKQHDNDLNTSPMSTQSEMDPIRSGPDPEAKSPQRCSEDGEGDLLLKTTADHKCAGGRSKLYQSCMIPELSLKPLVGKVSHIVRRLKINLLDMDAALPEQAFRPSMSNLVRRCAWRAFVKSAESIFEMVQATILLEHMIKSEYLKNGWWYWSSLTAAAKTPTVSSLALRIYSLDDSIIYLKDKDPRVLTSLDPPAETMWLINKTTGKKKKDTAEAGPS
ncbi:methyl-CpG-binding domain-containing protein 9-like [Iris pallida]|uniref:Methyl-CpG-binding domain-containing protein 9-like n=1 Tax=Iris pallida TaxID=29817 RepID=A0AAX6DN84_IRIPA|nr:methyl-CpG-binding domain-containing protein 9-like [Iris pallida]